MSQLGSIYGDEEKEASKPKGEDLYFIVDVPRKYLGDAEGFVAEIPIEIEKDGLAVRRVVTEGDEDGVPLHLPEGFVSGRTLRLRRQGGVRDDGIPGDLFVKVELVGPARRASEQALEATSGTEADMPPSLTPWLLGAGLFVLAALGFGYLLVR